MEKNLRLIVIDELGDSYCFEAFRVPEAETLTRLVRSERDGVIRLSFFYPATLPH